MSEVTRILNSHEPEDPQAAGELLNLVYSELRRLAAVRMAAEQPGHTLQATALVHEAWLRLGGDGSWEDRQHFFRAAAEAMRRILVDSARRKNRLKRGEGERPIPLDLVDIPIEGDLDKLLLVDEVLARFAEEEPDKAEIVKLRYFAGLKYAEIAALLGVSEKTVKRHWTYAKAWLFDAIKDS